VAGESVTNDIAIGRDDERVKIANKFGVVAPKHDALFRQRLMEQIRKCKHRYLSECQELSALDMLRDDDGTARHVSEIERIHSPRFSLGLKGVDEVLGTDPVSGTEGLPRGACLIFGAPKGMGKTRLTVQIAAAVGHPDYPPDEEMDLNGVLFIQNEEKVEVFLGRNGKSWTNKHNILLSSSDNLTQHESLIKNGDTVIHNGKEMTVNNHNIKSGFCGTTIFGDSYRMGTIPVQVVVFN
jgi:sRNA-binding carbon storage regulator CsrA